MLQMAWLSSDLTKKKKGKQPINKILMGGPNKPFWRLSQDYLNATFIFFLSLKKKNQSC